MPTRRCAWGSGEAKTIGTWRCPSRTWGTRAELGFRLFDTANGMYPRTPANACSAWFAIAGPRPRCYPYCPPVVCRCHEISSRRRAVTRSSLPRRRDTKYLRRLCYSLPRTRLPSAKGRTGPYRRARPRTPVDGRQVGLSGWVADFTPLPPSEAKRGERVGRGAAQAWPPPLQVKPGPMDGGSPHAWMGHGWATVGAVCPASPLSLPSPLSLRVGERRRRADVRGLPATRAPRPWHPELSKYWRNVGPGK